MCKITQNLHEASVEIHKNIREGFILIGFNFTEHVHLSINFDVFNLFL